MSFRGTLHTQGTHSLSSEMQFDNYLLSPLVLVCGDDAGHKEALELPGLDWNPSYSSFAWMTSDKSPKLCEPQFPFLAKQPQKYILYCGHED